MPDYRLLHAGDTALVVEFGQGIDRRLNAKVLALARRIEQNVAAGRLVGIVETVPTFRSLMVYYDPLVLNHAALAVRIDELVRDLQPAMQAGRVWRLPVCYDPCVAPDLEDVARRTGLTPTTVVERHSAETYHVYMLGFLPGQAYMGDLPAELDLPRRATPRLTIPAGSLAIAMNMTCIFPLQSPCGWHLIGRSPVPLWDGEAGKALLAPGDQVMFAPVSLREFDQLCAKVMARALKIEPIATGVGVAA
ncbi:MAG TPA: 5-oxoprolinase subunit PxpB [Xanthobacteraceae bacterium]|nr:5-oxoprolinase subunit PxpB [Xanthobacteraceae bacterium]